MDMGKGLDTGPVMEVDKGNRSLLDVAWLSR